jgi:hypothetical protein
VIHESQEDDGLVFEDGTGCKAKPLQMMMMFISYKGNN